ncbi:CheY-like chemotaxis protein [Bradyrhizobium sp. LM4.3]
MNGYFIGQPALLHPGRPEPLRTTNQFASGGLGGGSPYSRALFAASSRSRNSQSVFGRLFLMTHAVLLVDDDPAVLDVIASMLEEIGCKVIRANRGAEAFLLQHHDRISVLITDINMPSMDGHELAERATRLRPALKVLQLSGRATARRFPDDPEAILRR